MPGPFDTTLKALVQAYPADWIAFLGLSPPGPVEVIDANLATVTAAVDKVVRVGGADPWIVHLEFQSSYDSTISQRMHSYNALLDGDRHLPVDAGDSEHARLFDVHGDRGRRTCQRTSRRPRRGARRGARRGTS